MKKGTRIAIGFGVFMLGKFVQSKWGDSTALILGMIIFGALCIGASVVEARLQKRNKQCPICGYPTEVRLREEHTDPRQKPVSVGKMVVFSGKVTKTSRIICCPSCGWELRTKKKTE